MNEIPGSNHINNTQNWGGSAPRPRTAHPKVNPFFSQIKRAINPFLTPQGIAQAVYTHPHTSYHIKNKSKSRKRKREAAYRGVIILTLLTYCHTLLPYYAPFTYILVKKRVNSPFSL